MPTRLLIAYVMIALMAAALATIAWHFTKDRRRVGRNRRAHGRAKRKSAEATE
jgi:uncharacterized membrane protein